MADRLDSLNVFAHMLNDSNLQLDEITMCLKRLALLFYEGNSILADVESSEDKLVFIRWCLNGVYFFVANHFDAIQYEYIVNFMSSLLILAILDGSLLFREIVSELISECKILMSTRVKYNDHFSHMLSNRTIKTRMVLGISMDFKEISVRSINNADRFITIFCEVINCNLSNIIRCRSNKSDFIKYLIAGLQMGDFNCKSFAMDGLMKVLFEDNLTKVSNNNRSDSLAIISITMMLIQSGKLVIEQKFSNVSTFESGITFSYPLFEERWLKLFRAILGVSKRDKVQSGIIYRELFKMVSSKTTNFCNNKPDVVSLSMLSCFCELLSNLTSPSHDDLKELYMLSKLVMELSPNNAQFKRGVDLTLFVLSQYKTNASTSHLTTLIDINNNWKNVYNSFIGRDTSPKIINQFLTCSKMINVLMLNKRTVCISTNSDLFHLCHMVDFDRVFDLDLLENVLYRYGAKKVLEIMSIFIAELNVSDIQCKFSHEQWLKVAHICLIPFVKQIIEIDPSIAEDISSTYPYFTKIQYSKNEQVCSFHLLSYLPFNLCGDLKQEIFKRLLKEDFNERELLLLIQSINNLIFTGLSSLMSLEMIGSLFAKYSDVIYANVVLTTELFQCLITLHCYLCCKASQIYRNMKLRTADSDDVLFNFVAEIQCFICTEGAIVANKPREAEDIHYRMLKLLFGIVSFYFERPSEIIRHYASIKSIISGVINHCSAYWREDSLNIVIHLIEIYLKCSVPMIRSDCGIVLELLIKKLGSDNNIWPQFQIKISEAINKVIDENNISEIEPTVLAIESILKLSPMRTNGLILITLCKLIFYDDKYLFSHIITMIQNVISYRNISEEKFFEDCKVIIAEFVCKIPDFVLGFVNKFAAVFNISERKLLSLLLPELIIYFAVQGKNESIEKMKIIINAVKAEENQETLWYHSYDLPSCIVYFYMNLCPQKISEVKKFIQCTFDTSFENIIKTYDVTRTIHLLATHLWENKMRVLDCLKWIAIEVVNAPGNVPLEFVVHPMFKQQRFLIDHSVGILHFFKRKMMETGVSVQALDKYVRSLDIFVSYIGKEGVKSIYLMYFSFLKICLKFEWTNLSEKVLKLWHDFFTLSSTADLKDMLVEGIAVLLAKKPTLTTKINDILSIIFSKRDELNESICHLHFILEYPELSKFHDNLRIILRQKSADDLFITFIKYAINNLKHQNEIVQQLAAKHLCSVLSSDIDKLIDLMAVFNLEKEIKPENMEIIHDLTRLLLLSVARSTVKDNITVFGRCLGLLGAVDPGRYRELTLMNVTSHDVSVVFVDSQEFSYTILMELCKVFSGMRTYIQMDAAGLAIQELIKAFCLNYSVSTTITTLDGPVNDIHCAFHVNIIIGKQLWEMFDMKFKDVFMPFHKSKFVLNIDDKKKMDNVPIFQHDESIKFEYWICNWTMLLIRQMKYPRHISVFMALVPIVLCDEQFARFILPHVIFVLLIENDEVVLEQIGDEISSVLDAIGEKEFDENLLNTSNSMLSSQNQIESATYEDAMRANFWVLKSAGQTIFNVLDYLKQWLNQRAVLVHYKKDPLNENIELNFNKVKKFIKSISKEDLAKASYKCGSYARSLLHLMDAYRDELPLEYDGKRKTAKQKRIISRIMQTHAALHERDEISGYLSAFKSDLEPFAETLQLEYEGKYDLALPLYEHRLREYKMQEKIDGYPPTIIDLYQSIFRIQMINISALPSVISRVECCLNDKNLPISNYEALNSSRIEALYKLGDWGKLEEALPTGNDWNKSWTTNIAGVLCNARNQNFDRAMETMENVWKQQLTKLDLAAIEGGNYERVHSSLSQLSMITDIETVINTGTMCTTVDASKALRKMAKIDFPKMCLFFKERYKLTEGSYQNQDSLLTLHYNLFQLVHETQLKSYSVVRPDTLALINREISEIWLEKSRLYRKSNQYSSALTCLLNVKDCHYVESIIEKGKLFWKQGKIEEALQCLNKGIDDLAPVNYKAQKMFRHKYDTKSYWKMMLLSARLSDLTCRYSSEKTKSLYQSVFSFNKKSEEAHFRYAHFLDRALKLNKTHNEDVLVSALTEYGEALLHGSKYIYQSMPRLLSLWLDRPTTAAKQHTHNIDMVTKVMTKNINRIPKFQFYVCLTQILSRLCHENKKDVMELLFELVLSIFVTFHKQTVWFLMAMEGSTFSARRQRFNTLMQKIGEKSDHLFQYVNKMVELCKALRLVSELDDANKSKEIKLEKSANELHNLLRARDYSDVIIPLHHQLFGQLHGQLTTSELSTPFPSKTICIAGIEDIVTVLPSLTRPKKMVWLGTDGMKYIIVAKPKDDLRRDSRIMELNGMLNKLMRKKMETRHRMLYIRTYAVTPLGEQGGLIEWVNNTEGFRPIIVGIYNERKYEDVFIRIKTKFPALEDSNEVKHSKFMNEVLPLCPTVFYNWFKTQFPDPSIWYRSLQRYTRSTAVMSMVGYILGLGDRHGENILIDRTNGDIVHIDFNCLFNAGSTLQWPEMVPFRLTRNMLDALGPCKEHNGLFRSSCEATLRLLRDEIEPIMAVFRPMYYDTLTEIKEPRASKSNKQLTTGSLTEKQLELMEQRLQGNVDQSPLSVEGQVSCLISQAVDTRLLCQMFIGWAAYL